MFGDDDLAFMFQAMDSENVTWLHNSTSTQIRAFFDRPSQEVKLYGNESQTFNPHVTVRESQVVGVKVNDQMTVRGITYYIVEVDPDGTGLTCLYLSKTRA